MAIIEVCAEGLASGLLALEGGADRVELCENLAVGGVTPGLGAIAGLCSARGGTPIHVLIRPRGGHFMHDPAEVEAMRVDVEAARGAGASGVVLGSLTAEGRVDRATTARLIEAARPLAVTFHKAFDQARDPFEALEDLTGLGVNRILTSGGAATAAEGLPLLAELVRRAAGRIAFQAGGSIRLEGIPDLIGAGVEEVHLGSAVLRDGRVAPGLVRRAVAWARSGSGVIYHLTGREEWDLARAAGSYRAASLATEGFIHASTAGQLEGSANRFFAGRSGTVVLAIDPGLVDVPILWEWSAHSATPFPHIYGPLRTEAISSVQDLVADREGFFRWPSR